MNSVVKAVVFWIVIVVSAFLLWQTVKSKGPAQKARVISYSDFLTRVAKGQISRVIIAGTVVRGLDTQDGNLRVIAPANQTAMLEALQAHAVDIWFQETSDQAWPSWLLNLAPLILLAALWFFTIRRLGVRELLRHRAISPRNPNRASARNLCTQLYSPFYPEKV
jgi:cell division protease FtsH